MTLKATSPCEGINGDFSAKEVFILIEGMAKSLPDADKAYIAARIKETGPSKTELSGLLLRLSVSPHPCLSPQGVAQMGVVKKIFDEKNRALQKDKDFERAFQRKPLATLQEEALRYGEKSPAFIELLRRVRAAYATVSSVDPHPFSSLEVRSVLEDSGDSALEA